MQYRSDAQICSRCSMIGWFVSVCSCIIADQVLDYGIFLKLDTAEGYMIHMGRLLKTFIILGCREYAECVAMHMNTLSYVKHHNTPAWQMMVNHFGCFNEELGEISLSVLSRAMLGDNHKHKIEHITEMYRLTPLYRAVCSDMKEQVGHLYKKEHSNRTLQVDGPEVQRVVRHMRMIVQSFHDGSYTVYDGCERAYKSADYAEEHQIFVYDPVPLWKDDIGKDVFDLLQHCGAKYTRPWVATHSDIWPESADTYRECDTDSETDEPSAMSDSA